MRRRGRPIKDFTKEDNSPFYCQKCGQETQKKDEHWVKDDTLVIRICEWCYKKRDN